MKSHTLILLVLLTGCGGVPQSYSGVSKPSETVYVRDTNGRTVARITDGSIFNTNGVRIGKVSKK
jgi:hypothetical protein